GMSLVTLLTLLLVVPGAIWGRYLTRDDELEKAFCDGDLISLLRFFLLLVVPFLLIAAVTRLITDTTYPSFSFWLLLLLLIVFALGKLVLIYCYEVNKCTEDKSKRLRLFFIYVFRYGISVLAGLTAMLTLVKLFGLSRTDYKVAHFFICVVGVVIANAIVAFFVHEGHWNA